MFKIWYAANNTINSKLQLYSVLKELSNIPDIQVKVSGYKNYVPNNMKLDFVLDSLLDVYEKTHEYCEEFNLLPSSHALNSYLNLITMFDPDLIISDFEIITSYIATNASALHTKHWIASTGLLYNALSLTPKLHVGIVSPILRQTIAAKNLKASLINCDRRFVISHFGDVLNNFTLYKQYEWVRPEVSTHSSNDIDGVVATFANPNYKQLSYLKNNGLPNLKVYTDKPFNTKYFSAKSYYSEDYSKDIASSIIGVNNGESLFLADNFYNRKHSLIFTDFDDLESVLNATLTELLFTGKSQLISKELIYEDGQTKIDKKQDIHTLSYHIKQLIKEKK